MSIDKPERQFQNVPRKLSREKINEILRKYPNVKLDRGDQHFVIERDGKTTFNPTWEKIPYADGTKKPIEAEIEKSIQGDT